MRRLKGHKVFLGVVMKKILGSFLAVFLLATVASAQKTEITITLNEQFFDALLDAIYQNGGMPDIPLAQNSRSSAFTR